ncbi:MAG: hypothetical protein HY062_18355 [Bacteroidetes bacterium]|nr:hypothetical protein [Bacteroidota bacterium]
MKNLHYIFLFLLGFSSNYLLAHDSLAVKSLVSRTEVSIYKAQKEMIAGKAVKKPKELSAAIQLQVIAVSAYKSNDLKSAVWYSLKAREYSNAILEEMKLEGIDQYLLNSSENNLLQKYKYESSDEDFHSRIAPNVIEETILFDPQKIRASYLMSVN